MREKIVVTSYSDVLCVWAHIAQARIEEIKGNFPEQVSIDYRFCSVFGDTRHKIGHGWSDRGGFRGFGKHVSESAAAFLHVRIHPELWLRDAPASSTPAHLALKAVQCLEPDKCEDVLIGLRRAFFEECRNIGTRDVIDDVIARAGISVEAINNLLDDGAAHAALEADRRDQQAMLLQGSPTLLLNHGRQKLYGNVGYRVIEANIRELLRVPTAGEASWC